jgi:hypothetical protein
MGSCVWVQRTVLGEDDGSFANVTLGKQLIHVGHIWLAVSPLSGKSVAVARDVYVAGIAEGKGVSGV